MSRTTSAKTALEQVPHAGDAVGSSPLVEEETKEKKHNRPATAGKAVFGLTKHSASVCPVIVEEIPPTIDRSRNHRPSMSSSSQVAKKMPLIVVGPVGIVTDLVFVVIVLLPTILLDSYGKPFRRGFYCDDESIRYPHVAPETVPFWLMGVVGTFLPITVMVFIESYRALKFDPRFFNKPIMDPRHECCRRPIHPLVSNLYIYIGYFLFGGGLCLAVTDIAKYSIGRLRPHFYTLCAPAIDCSLLTPFTYVVEPNCTSTNFDALKHARLSFPSGHSSMSGYAMGFTVIYLQTRLVWPMVSVLVKHFLQLVFVLLAVACVCSRISDYMHHWSDVLLGLVLGIFVACVTTVHMLGLFRQPHFIFSPPAYLAIPTTDISFGGDQFHNEQEIQYVEEHRFKERPIAMETMVKRGYNCNEAFDGGS